MTSNVAALNLGMWLRRIEVALVLSGSLGVGVYCGAYAASARDQVALARELEFEATRTRDVSLARVSRTMAQGSVVGRLEVPRLGLSVVAREGADPRTLRSAVGHVRNTAFPGERGNAAFAAHRDSFFRPLKDIRGGDRIVVTTADGRHEYIVRDTRVVKPTDVSVLEPTREPTLTLVTCYPFRYIGAAPNRFIVRATLAQPGTN